LIEFMMDTAILRHVSDVDDGEARALECMRQLLSTYGRVLLPEDIAFRQGALSAAQRKLGQDDEQMTEALEADMAELEAQRFLSAQYEDLAAGVQARRSHIDQLLSQHGTQTALLSDGIQGMDLDADDHVHETRVRAIDGDMDASRYALAACEAREFATRAEEEEDAVLWAKQGEYAESEHAGALSSLASLCTHGAGKEPGGGAITLAHFTADQVNILMRALGLVSESYLRDAGQTSPAPLAHQDSASSDLGAEESEWSLDTAKLGMDLAMLSEVHFHVQGASAASRELQCSGPEASADHGSHAQASGWNRWQPHEHGAVHELSPDVGAFGAGATQAGSVANFSLDIPDVRIEAPSAPPSPSQARP